jgi:maltose/moltooligosaccharide transporter
MQSLELERKPRLSFWQIWNMSFGFFGIQIGFALQGANVSRIFQTLGAKEDEIPILWLAAPLTGLIVQPIIGYLSDRTWGGLGRRRPFFLVGALLSAIALCIMPSSPTVWVAAGMLWVLDASINISMEPFRALVGDLLPPEQRNRGFAMQSVLIGSGAVLASLMPSVFTWFGVANDSGPGIVPPSVRMAFYFGAAAFVIAVVYTVVTTREYSPEEMRAFEAAEKEGKGDLGQHLPSNGFWVTVTQLAVVQFFTWFALFALFIFATPAIAAQVYGVTDPLVDTARYNQAGNWVGIGYAVFNGTAAVFGFIIPWVADRIGRRLTHMLCLICGGWGLGSIYFLPSLAGDGDSLPMLGSFFMIGIAWSSILSMPYAMLSSAIPASRMGFFMGFFNFFICLPQIVASLGGLNLLTRLIFGKEAIHAMLLGGCLMLVAGLLTLTVRDADPKPLPRDAEGESLAET